MPPATLGRPAAEQPSTSSTPDKATHLLLYLCEETWRDERLVEEVAAARAAKLPIVMAHENDAARGGCPFSRFFETTPHELIGNGLYSDLAFSFFLGVYRQVSLALLGKGLGATAVRRTTSARLRESLGKLSGDRPRPASSPVIDTARKNETPPANELYI